MTLKSSIKKGKHNVVADALSRKDEDVEALLCVISIIQPDWVVATRGEWKNDLSVWTLIQKLQKDPSVSDTFVWKNDSHRYKDRLYTIRTPNSNKISFWNYTPLI